MERGRERLLAGDPAAAAAAFARAQRWPGTARGAGAGLALARAHRGQLPDAQPGLADLAPFAPAALLEAALEREDLRGARALGQLLVRAGHPLGPLYAGAVALERGDEAEAARRAGSSPVPLASRPAGRQLEQALVLRAFGASAVVRDRRGALVGGLDGQGRLALAEGLDPLLLPPFEKDPPRRRRLPARREPALPYWLSPEDARAAARSGGLRLTLDLDLARLALESLGRWRGTIVLVEPRTGSILAAVSDPRTRAREGPAAFSQRREPASISKIITAAAAYRSGIDADAAIGRMTCRGVERFGGRPLWCSWKAGPLAGLDHALAISCNTSFARVGARVGRERLVDELRRWGFDAGPEALMGAAGRIHTPPRNERQLADLSIGLTLSDITPLHAALLATVVAGGGTMPEPRLVANVCGPVGLSDRVAELPPVREVVGPRTVPPLLRAMRAVALYGTGTGLSPRGFGAAMKTGTAAEYRKGYHVNYIGVAPTPDPTVGFCVRITYRPNSRAVNRAAREVTKALLAGLAARRIALERGAQSQRAHAAWPAERQRHAQAGERGERPAS
jgi:peptidoglycan glycosyltransferase